MADFEQTILKPEIAEGEARLRQFADAMPLIVWAARPDGVVDYYNRRWFEYTGMSPDQRGDASWEPVLHPDDVALTHERWSHAVRTGEAYEIEYRYRRASDGQYRWHLGRAEPVRDDDGAIVRWYGTSTDIHDRRIAEGAWRMSDFRFQRLVEHSPMSTQLFAPDGSVRQVNRAWVKLFGGAPEDVAAYNILKDKQLAECGVSALIEKAFNGEPVTIDPIPYVPDRGHFAGQERWCGAYAYPVRGEAGQVEEVVLIHHDLSDRKAAEQAMRASQQRLEMLFENAQDAIFLADNEGRYLDVNPAACSLTGYSREELLDRGLWDLTPSADQVAGREAWRQFIAAGKHSGEYTLVRKDGTSVEAEYRAVANIQPHLHLSVLRDVSQRKRAMNRLARLYEVSAALSEALTPSDVARVAVEQGIVALGAMAGSLSLLSSDGSALEMAGSHGYPAEVMEPWQCFGLDTPIPLAEAVRKAEPIYLESPEERLIRYPALNAVKARSGTQASACIPLLVGGKAIGVLGLSFDRPGGFSEEDREFMLSLSRQCAQAMERARLFETERRANEAKSQFLATLSHELRTPLTPVMLTISLMETHPGLPEDLREDVATIRRNVELESRLISDLLDLTRIAKGKLQLDEQDVDLHLILRSAIDICQREASAKLVVDLRATHHTVRGDSTRLQQIFWNLVNNAIKFTGQDGHITVRSENAENGRVRVEVNDTGAGIDCEILPRLFAAFEQGNVRTSHQQAGLGLGLAISRSLVEAHHGSITASSPGQGQGATFTVDLPVVEVAAFAKVPPLPPGPVAETPSLAVLLVEDHEPTLRVMTKLLRRLGHRVTGVTTVASATAAARQDGFDLIISDLGLPDGSGLDVMRHLRDRYAGRAIALTGYGMESDIAASRDAGFTHHLTKPVDLQTLSAAIAQVRAALQPADQTLPQ